jgi:EAL domain-containing protein (putative c-di-GMP-specific phosphodiesterase class I)
MACYAAKDGGRNRVHLYKPSDEEVAERRGEMDWVSEILDAIETGRLYLMVQPIMPLDACNGGRPSHYELLLRMRDRRGNEILPMAFLPAAERYNLMSEIDGWVIRTVMAEIAGNVHLPADCMLLLNLSGNSLADEDFVDFLTDQLATISLPLSRLCFEIAEASAISNLRSIGDSIKRLRKLGCRVSLDDFGSGLSAFGYLKNMQVDYIKIDGGLVRDMLHDPVDAAMVRAINEIGHVVGVETIAECIETGEVMDALRELGVDYGQGHSIATPRPVNELFAAGANQRGLKLVKF